MTKLSCDAATLKRVQLCSKVTCELGNVFMQKLFVYAIDIKACRVSVTQT